MTEADLALHAATLTKDDYSTDFGVIVANMRKLDPRIELFTTLKNKSVVIGKKYSRGIDRVKIDGKQEGSDIYTSAHYIFGTLIIRRWRAFKKKKINGIKFL